jgi:hypothetical protein
LPLLSESANHGVPQGARTTRRSHR